jgi:phage/conjugal plasmid C-4 type zinc finger TraR family protein
MPDVFDLAQEREERERDAAIQRARLNAADDQQPSARLDCEECEDPIPEERRAILPGARRCTQCQRILDNDAGLGR